MKRRTIVLAALICALALPLQGCAGTAEGTEPAPKPMGVEMKANVAWPYDKLEVNGEGTPLLRVYVVDTDKVETMDVESMVVESINL